jgi:hypothetical protein
MVENLKTGYLKNKLHMDQKFRRNFYFLREFLVRVLTWRANTLAVLIFGCTASLQVIDVLDLPPPTQVRAARRNGQVTVRWRPGAEQKHPQFTGYKLFVAKRSLAATPVAELPPALSLPDTATAFSFAAPDTATLFIHLRSCAGKHKLSLPSLPEVALD